MFPFEKKHYSLFFNTCRGIQIDGPLPGPNILPLMTSDNLTQLTLLGPPFLQDYGEKIGHRSQPNLIISDKKFPGKDF